MRFIIVTSLYTQASLISLHAVIFIKKHHVGIYDRKQLYFKLCIVFVLYLLISTVYSRIQNGDQVNVVEF